MSHANERLACTISRDDFQMTYIAIQITDDLGH